jgi:flagellar biosynthesis protein FliQ
MNLDKTKNVICPNCGAEFSLGDAKGPSWNTLDTFQSLVAVTTPMIVGLFAVVLLQIAEQFLNFTPSIVLRLGVCIGMVAISFPIIVRLLVNYQEKTLKGLGVCMYRISCNCRPHGENTFTIIRAIGLKQELTPEQTSEEHK